MTFDPSLIFSVRRELNDVPEDYLSDEVIYQALSQADAYLNKVLDPDVDEVYRQHCLVVVAAYFAYVKYVASVERGLGSIPATSAERLRALRELAVALVRVVSRFNIRDDLSIDDAVVGSAIAVGLTESVLDG